MVISILFLFVLLQTTHNIALLLFCISVLLPFVFEQQLGERSNPENTASFSYFPHRLWKNTDIGFPAALSAIVQNTT